MKFTKSILKRTNWIVSLIILLNCIIFIILIVTFIVPVEDLPPIYHYPFMVYIEYALALILLLFLISGVLLRKNEGKFKEKSENWVFLTRLFDKIDWEVKIPLWRKILRWLSLLSFIGITLVFLGVGFMAFQLLFSPMNLLYLPFIFCMIVIWISMGVKKENIDVVLVLIIIVGAFMGLVIGAIIIAEDQRILPLAVSYQIITILLLGIRMISYLSIERKKTN